MNEVLAIITGLIAGVLTALSIRMRSNTIKPTHSQFVYHAIKKIDEYEKLGIITSEEKEQLFSIFKERIPEQINIVQKIDLSSIKQEISTLIDQKISEINNKLDEVMKKNKSLVQVSKAPIQPKITQDIKNESIEEERKDLDEIKRRIFDTLSKLEKTEIE